MSDNIAYILNDILMMVDLYLYLIAYFNLFYNLIMIIYHSKIVKY